VNWSTPVAVSSGGGVQGSSICISRNGQVNVVWQSGTINTTTTMYDRSTNGGVTFGTDLTISSGADPIGLPNNVVTFPSIDVDNSLGPRGGWLYCVFADNRNGDCDVF